VRPSQGQIDVLVKHCVVWGENDSNGVLEDKPLTVELPKDFGKQGQRRPRDLTWQEIYERREELEMKIGQLETAASWNAAFSAALTKSK